MCVCVCLFVCLFVCDCTSLLVPKKLLMYTWPVTLSYQVECDVSEYPSSKGSREQSGRMGQGDP